MTQVVVDESDRDRLQRGLHRRDLGEDVDAVHVLLHHPLDSADLSLDAPEPAQVGVLVVVVAVRHVFDIIPHRGIIQVSSGVGLRAYGPDRLA